MATGGLGLKQCKGLLIKSELKVEKTAKVRVAPPGCKIVDPPEQGLLPKTSSSGDLQTLKLTNGNIEVKVMSVFVCSRSHTAIRSYIDIAKGLSAFTKFTLKISNKLKILLKFQL